MNILIFSTKSPEIMNGKHNIIIRNIENRNVIL